MKRWAGVTRFLDDGRICLSDAATERAQPGIAIGRGNWRFAGADAAGHGGRPRFPRRSGPLH
ncbi:MAG: IS66 family transposase [Methylocella sp.]